MFLDLLFPRWCVVCKSLGSYICLSCQKKLVAVEQDICIYCKKSSYWGLTHPLCKRRYGVDGCISIFFYNNILKSIIKAIKYRGAHKIFGDLFSLMPVTFLYKLNYFKRGDSNWCLEPIPLHEYRLKERGFNQADYIGVFLKKYIRNSVAVEALQRTKYTLPQAQLKAKNLKLRNLQNAFSLRPGTETCGQKIILIDDVVTTGNTVKEACRILKKNGASKVFIITLARG